MKSINRTTILAVTYILIGDMLMPYGNIGDGWTSSLTVFLGLIFFWVGLNQLKKNIDAAGRSGITKLKWGIVISIFANIVDFIPFIGGIPASILNIIAFILHLAGLISLRGSSIIGTSGKSGITFLIVASVIVIIGGIFGIIPFAGDYIESGITFIAFILIPFGWLKVQEGILLTSEEEESAVSELS